MINLCIQNRHLPQRLLLYFMGCNLHFLVFLLICQIFILKVQLPIPHACIMRILLAFLQHACHVYRWQSKLSSVLPQKLFKCSAFHRLQVFILVFKKSLTRQRCLEIWFIRQRGPHSVAFNLVRRGGVTSAGPVCSNRPRLRGFGRLHDLCRRTV